MKGGTKADDTSVVQTPYYLLAESLTGTLFVAFENKSKETFQKNK